MGDRGGINGQQFARHSDGIEDDEKGVSAPGDEVGEHCRTD